ncbi:MAG: DUF1559 domain-containing protein [Gemmatales bacterium]|nr:DUF1559 domain-containing protein [Gemmatales bacterium]
MHRKQGRIRPGFTVFDLLVIVVVLLMLIPLLLPMIHRARMASQAMRCGNNLSQLALSFHNFHNDCDLFPTGGGNAEQGRGYRANGKIERTPPLGGKLPQGAEVLTAPWQEWGWAYQILPYLEQHAAFALAEDDKIRQHEVPPYFCPARRSPALNERNAKGLTLAALDYAGNGGITGPAKKFDALTAARYVPPFEDYTATGAVIRSSHWYPEKGAKLRSVSLDGGIPDGTSNTVLLLEKRMQLGMVNKNPPNDDWSYVDGWSDDTIVRYHPEDEKLQPKQDNQDPVPPFAMGSAHAKFMYVLMLDRSIRRIRYLAKPEALAAIMVRDDRMNIRWDDLE